MNLKIEALLREREINWAEAFQSAYSVVEHWGCSNAERDALLGLNSPKDATDPLSEECKDRIHSILRIEKALITAFTNPQNIEGVELHTKMIHFRRIFADHSDPFSLQHLIVLYELAKKEADQYSSQLVG
uniref:hypothetical protein n=1 Tax=Litorivivens sp. TaxID=2020868 RepID=UPI003568F12B